MNACTQPDLMVAVQACLDYAKAGLFRSIADVADAMKTKPGCRAASAISRGLK